MFDPLVSLAPPRWSAAFGGLCLAWLAGCEGPGGSDAPASDAREEDSDSVGDTSGSTSCDTLTARAHATPLGGRIPLEVSLDASGSCGPEPLVSWLWEVDGAALFGDPVAWTALRAGSMTATLTVTDAAGDTATNSIVIEVQPDQCPIVLPAVELGSLDDDALIEASGLLLSRRDADVLWSHNDSGNTPQLFAVGRDGAALGTWTLDVAEGDWEDLGGGLDPDTGAPLLFIGDIGNNDGSRDSLRVYVLEEPLVNREAEPSENVVETWRTLTLRLPEPLNVDALLIDPATGDLLLVSNATNGRSVVLRKPGPHMDGEDVTLERVAELALGAGSLPGDTRATGAAISPLGDRVVVRTRDEAWMWLRDGSQTVAEALSGTPCAVPLPVQPLGESIAFDLRDGGLLTTSEGAHEPLFWVPFEEEPDCFDTLQAVIVASSVSGPLPFEVTLDAGGSCAPLGIAEARWDLAGVAEPLFGETVTASWLASGTYVATLTLVDSAGTVAVAETTIEVLPGDCPADDGKETLGTVVDPELNEISGVAVSARDPNVLWVHNDSGDDPRIFAIDRAGALVGTWTLDVARGDFEDIATGFAADGTPELWLGDIGDNAEVRAGITLHYFPEPEVAGGGALVTEIATISLTYPDGPRNSETFMVDPVTGDLYLVTKDPDGHSAVFRKPAPHTDGEAAVLEYVASLIFGEPPLDGQPRTTAGEFSPDGAWIVVRTYGDTAYLWRRDRSQTVDDAFAGEPCPVELPTEPQGEAIGFDTDGQALITISEGIGSAIFRVPLVR